MKVLLILWISTLAFKVNAQNCYADVDTCESYSCIENKMKCGKKGYLQSFGKHYCEKFLYKRYKRLSNLGHAWLRDVRFCLQEQVLEIAENNSCKTLKKMAIKSHKSCYIETGFCQLKTKDKLIILSDLKEVLTSRYILPIGLTGINVLNECRRY